MRFVPKVLLAGGAILSQCAFGACVPLHPDDIHDRVAFASAVVRSLEDFQDANATLSGIGKSKGAIDLLSTIDIANEKLRCASDDLSGYSGEDEQAVSLTVATIQKTAAKLIELNTITRQLMIAELNGDLGREKAGDHAARMANLAGLYRQAWGLLPLAATTAFLALEESDGPNSQRLRLGNDYGSARLPKPRSAGRVPHFEQARRRWTPFAGRGICGSALRRPEQARLVVQG